MTIKDKAFLFKQGGVLSTVIKSLNCPCEHFLQILITNLFFVLTLLKWKGYNRITLIVICEDINFDNDLMNSFPLRPAEEVAPASDLSNPNR